MRSWFFFISQDEIEAAALDLMARHGVDARDEAIRLAGVGRRIGSHRNSKIFRRAAQHIAAGCPSMAANTRVPRPWLAKVMELVAEFSTPRIAADETTPSRPTDESFAGTRLERFLPGTFALPMMLTAARQRFGFQLRRLTTGQRA